MKLAGILETNPEVKEVFLAGQIARDKRHIWLMKQGMKKKKWWRRK